jgi:hypothetical protein
MKNTDSQIERLLRSAATVAEEKQTSAPFGFDTRVVALWRAGLTNGNGVGRLIRHVAMLAAAVIIVSTAATIREFQQSQESVGESLTNEFAIADSVIQNEFSQ